MFYLSTKLGCSSLWTPHLSNHLADSLVEPSAYSLGLAQDFMPQLFAPSIFVLIFSSMWALPFVSNFLSFAASMLGFIGAKVFWYALKK